jgi:hypothetical protein
MKIQLWCSYKAEGVQLGIPQTPSNKADVPPLDFPSGQILNKNCA